MGFRRVVVLVAALAPVIVTLFSAAAVAEASSPPSGQIAFVRNGDIWAKAASGGSALRLTTTASHESDPAWSPDGSSIAFIRDGGQGQIWLMNADGTNQRRVPFTLSAQTMPGTDESGTSRMIDEVAFSPDGADITVCAHAATFDIPGGIFNDQLYLVHPDGTGQRRIGPLIGGAYAGMEGLSWRPAGDQLLLGELFRQGGGRIVRYDLQSDEVSIPFPSDYGGRTMWNPAWSPDGRYVAACVQDDPDAYMGPTHVAVIDMQTGEERALRPSALTESERIQPAWSPDGSWLACSSWGAQSADGPDAFLISADGAESRLFATNASDPVWCPSASAPAPAPAPAVALILNGLQRGVLKHGKSLGVRGTVTPTSLAGSKITITVQLRRGAKWPQVAAASTTITAKGAYVWTYKPTKRGGYRIRATIAQTTAFAAAASKWRKFTVN
jgi:Tol biopolymer transport system component